ncbi:MAG: hypothetical protein DI537_40645 [Stutzerimonas stutzeri]|nr:MAG: hypothetical protein DI537_40645 [Stutzerimonas stutzeri]
MLIYVAAPYSHPVPEVVATRMDLFTRTMAKLIEQGHHPVSPLMNHFLAEKIEVNFPLSWQYWEEYSSKLLDRCDAMMVITMHGWEESTGVTAEIKMAIERGKPIEYIEPVSPTIDEMIAG